MTQFFLPALLAIVISAIPARAQQQLDASPTLFTVMAAINAAGYSADLSSADNHPIRDEVRAEIARRNPPSLPVLKRFFEVHRQHTDVEELSQYISFALTVEGPPDFIFTQRDVDLPPDVAPLKDLAPVLARFYKEANIAELWERSQEVIDQYIARYHGPVSDAVLAANVYLRQPTSGVSGRRFQIYVDLLGAPDQIQMRNYGADLTIVVTASPQARIFDIRHAYLHYVLDSIVARSREILDRKNPIAENALRAPALDTAYKEDFPLLVMESLIKAIEGRMDHDPGAAQRALAHGYILAPFFAEQLPAYEGQQASMGDYFADMVKAIDLAKEDARLASVEFESKSAPRSTPAEPVTPTLSAAARALADAVRSYLGRAADPANLEKAKALYTKAAALGAGPEQAAAYYGLARVAILQKDPETAEGLFVKTLESGPDEQVKAWAYVYLGRLALAAGDGQEAALNFEQALKVNGASDMARSAASDGLKNKSINPNPNQ